MFELLPLEIQLIILSYNPCFIRLNKYYRINGLNMFIEHYSNLPVSYNEVINYKIRFYHNDTQILFKHRGEYKSFIYEILFMKCNYRLLCSQVLNNDIQI